MCFSSSLFAFIQSFISLLWMCYFSKLKYQEWTVRGTLHGVTVLPLSLIVWRQEDRKPESSFTVLSLHFVLLQVPALQQYWVFGARIIHPPTEAGKTVSSFSVRCQLFFRVRVLLRLGLILKTTLLAILHICWQVWGSRSSMAGCCWVCLALKDYLWDETGISL